MKILKSGTSILLALVMLVSVVVSVLAVTTTQAEPSSASSSIQASGSEDDTDLTIDFDYDPKMTVNDAKKQMVNEKNYPVNSNYLSYYSDDYDWIHLSQPKKKIDQGYNDDGNDNSFRHYLEEKNTKTDYLVLDTDFLFYNLKTHPEPIVITSDKVLDLNGKLVYLRDNSNKKNEGSAMTDHEIFWNSRMFEIEEGATLTIIDSSKASDPTGVGTGKIYTNARIIQPFDNKIKGYVTRDIFWVNDGNLIVYGGTFQAGRSRAQTDDGIKWSKIKKVIGAAVSLGVSIMDYYNGISSADAGLKDVKESFADKIVNATDNDNASDDNSQTQKTGENAVAEVKKDTPTSKDEKRNQAIDEKNDTNNKKTEQENKDSGSTKPTEPANNANKDGSAKQENEQGKNVDKNKDKNVKIQEAENKVAQASLNKESIMGIVDDGFEFIDSIIDVFKSSKPAVTESFLGTVVHVGNNSTFVSYGGKYIGYGSTANTRDAVIEVVEQPDSINERTKNIEGYDPKFNGGLVYVYDGDFEGRTGANIFNIVKMNGTTQTTYQAIRDKDGEAPKAQQVTLSNSETNGMQIINVYKNKPVNTKNITIRGGNFNNNAQLTMVGIHDGSDMTTFPGTPGYMNLGIESYNADFIKDGRIQIVDSYGDGALVLMDEQKDENEKIFHYRLFCSESELRYKQHLKVYPNEAETNTTHSFSLQSTYGESGSTELQTLTNTWADDSLGSERNSPYNSTERFFYYPINQKTAKGQSTSKTYYVMPSTIQNDVYGKNFAASNIWYYATPRNANGKLLAPFTYRDVNVQYTSSEDGKVKYDNTHDSAMSDLIANANKSSGTVLSYANSYDYLSDLTWFRYKVYRVDPLTRENLSESDKYGEDKPLADIVYGASKDSLKCKLPLAELEKRIQKDDSTFAYKAGEMYRIELYVDEYLSYNYTGSTFKTSLDNATLKSSILFACYDEWNETKESTSSDPNTADYTPLQWKTAPKAGEKAEINIVNGKAGQVDLQGRKIFDVYYQWYQVDDDGNETMIAGTPDSYIYRGNSTGEKAGYTIANIPSSSLSSFKDIPDPNNKLDVAYDTNGLPKSKYHWNADMLHAYSLGIMGDTCNTRLAYPTPSDTTKQPTLSTNYKKRFETGTDSLYIPADFEGKTVKVKAIVVNVFWPLNFDHVQVYESHPVAVTSSSVYAEMNVNYENDYIDKNGATLSISKLSSLDNNEYVKSVTYTFSPFATAKVERDMRALKRLGKYTGQWLVEKTISNLEAYKASEIPTAKFPDDFTLQDDYLNKIYESNKLETIRLKAKVTTSTGRSYTVPYSSHELGAPGTTGDCTWSLDSNGTLTVSGSGSMANYSLVKAPWYSKLSEIKKVNIGANVTHISQDGFTGAENLKTVNINGNDKTIGNNAFKDCINLDTLNMYNVASIGACAFYNTGLKSLLIAPTKIGQYAFSHCKNLESLDIRYVETIGKKAFYGCPKLLKVYLPDSVKTISESAFGFGDIGDVLSGLYDDFHMFATADNTAAINYVKENKINNSGILRGGAAWSYDIETATLTISPHDGETSTGDYSTTDIYGEEKLDTNALPWYCGSIGSATKNIKNLVIEDGITEIGDGVCYNLGISSLTLPTSVKRIGESAFCWCSNLKTIDLGRVETIEDRAFSLCISIEELTIPKSCKSIGNAFLLSLAKKFVLRNPHCTIGEVLSLGDIQFLPINANDYYGYEGSTLQQWINSSSDDSLKEKFHLIDPIPEIQVSDAIARKGSTISVNVNMYDNPGISAMKLKIDYPEQLELKDVSYNDKLFSSAPTGKNGIITWFSTKSENEAVDGTIATLTFKVKDDAELGKYPIKVTYDKDDVIKAEDKPVTFATTDGRVTVKNLKSGDANDDDKVNMKDINALQKYLNGCDISINEIATDVNGDGKVNMKDLVLLLQYVSGWEVMLK